MPFVQKNIIFEFYFENRNNEKKELQNENNRKKSNNDLTFKVYYDLNKIIL